MLNMKILLPCQECLDAWMEIHSLPGLRAIDIRLFKTMLCLICSKWEEVARHVDPTQEQGLSL